MSLIAAVLRWLDYTDRRAVLVVSRDGFILWAGSSKAALKTGAFFRTSVGPIAIPDRSLAARQDMTVDGRTGIELPAGVWFNEDLREMTVFADQYDFAISLVYRATTRCRAGRPTLPPNPTHTTGSQQPIRWDFASPRRIVGVVVYHLGRDILQLPLHQSLSLFNEQHKVSLHPHQPLRRGRAVDVGCDELLNFPSLQPHIPPKPGDVLIKQHPRSGPSAPPSETFKDGRPCCG